MLIIPSQRYPKMKDLPHEQLPGGLSWDLAPRGQKSLLARTAAAEGW